MRFSEYFYFVIRLIVGGVFMYSGFMKLIEPVAYFEASLAQYSLIPVMSYSTIAFIVPWFEWILGVFFVVGYASRFSAKLIAAFLVIFLVLLASTIFSGGEAPKDCGCFGEMGLKLNTKTVFALDLTLLIFTGLLLVINRFPFSIDRKLNKA